MPGGGSLLQLVAQGKQDVFLTGNPQITWFKMVYRRYTNFSIESQVMYFDGDPDFGRRLTCLVPRRGDLLGPIMLEVVLPQLTLIDGTPVPYTNAIGHALIDEITLEIGEQEIDKQTGEWFELWSSLAVPPGLQQGYGNMVGRVDGMIPPPVLPPGDAFGTDEYPDGTTKLYIPLQFWFNKNPGLYLPLLAIQYHPVRINVKLKPLQSLFYSSDLSGGCAPVQVNPAKIIDMRMWGDYVYLDTEERRRFVANTHEYLIEQIQYTPRVSIPADAAVANINLEFNHPLRELIWVVRRDLMDTTNEFFNYSSTSINQNIEVGAIRDLITSALIQVDGYDRFDARDAGYFRLVQPYQYHSNVPKNFIYVYSFSLRPEDMQPSGSLNASRIDTMTIQLTMRSNYMGPTTVTDPVTGRTVMNPYYTPPRGNCHARIYAKNHNVLRIVNGFAGLLFRI